MYLNNIIIDKHELSDKFDWLKKHQGASSAGLCLSKQDSRELRQEDQCLNPDPVPQL